MMNPGGVNAGGGIFGAYLMNKGTGADSGFGAYQAKMDHPSRRVQSDVFVNKPAMADPAGFMMQPNTVDQHMDRALAYDQSMGAEGAVPMEQPQRRPRQDSTIPEAPSGGRLIDRGVKTSYTPIYRR